MNKLTSYASLIGVVVAIGGGFYAWGEFNTRLDAIESKKAVSLAPINNQVLELRNSMDDFRSSVSALEVDLIDRIDALREKGITVLIVEQNARLSLSRSDRGYIFSNGKVVHTDAASRILVDPQINEYFLGTKTE